MLKLKELEELKDRGSNPSEGENSNNNWSLTFAYPEKKNCTLKLL